MTGRKLIPFLLVAFPAGLLAIGVTSMVNSHLQKAKGPQDPNEQVRLEAASLNQEPVSRETLERHIRILCETIGERHVGKMNQLEQAAFWIESSLGPTNLGYVVKREEYELASSFAENGTPHRVRNLVAELPGMALRDEIIIVGAHYDTVPGSPGANDNGSGVAALISIAQALAGEQQQRTIRFVAFANEEPPYFQTKEMGSWVHARGCAEREEKIVAMIAFDGLGYFTDEPNSQEVPPGLEGVFPKEGNFLAFVANENSRFLGDQAKRVFEGVSGIPAVGGVFPESIPGVGWSDHWSFWQEGFPAIMVTDTIPFRYEHYHKPTDTVDQLDMEQLEFVVKGLEEVIRSWANP
jgi:hypothetical protein